MNHKIFYLLSIILGLFYFNFAYAQTGAGVIQGYKVTTQLNDPAVNGLTATVDGTNIQASNPFIFSNLSAGEHTITVEVPTGWSVGYTACNNNTDCHTNTPISGNSATITISANGYVDLWWHFNKSVGKVQGYKLDHLGNSFSDPGATITVGSQSYLPSTNPYIADVAAGNQQVQSSVPQGYEAYYSTCTNCFNHPASSYVKGSQVTVSVPSNGYIDLHWKYVKPSQINFTLPSSSRLQQIFVGSLFTEIYQGYPNIYAPEVLYENGVYKMWYGGGGADIKDRIHYAVSNDGINWTKKGAVIEAPAPHYNANDPSMVKVGGKYYMYMTVSETDLLDRIYLTTSTDGTSWSTPIKVLDRGPYTWNSRYVARPTVIYDNGTFKMWYDTMSGTNYSDAGSLINVGYAVSSDGISWQKAAEPVFEGYAALDVKKIQDTFAMLIQGAWEGTHIATSKDGKTWTKQGTLISPDSGAGSAIIGHITPFLFIDPSTKKPKTVYLGGGTPDGPNGYNRNAMYMYALKEGELEKFLPLAIPAPTPAPTPVVACTKEAKLCPDGSYVGRTGPSCEFAPCPTSTSPKPVLPDITKKLYRGMRDPQVKILQQFMIKKGYLGAGYDTGYFGTLTFGAVKKFQCDNSIICSGTESSTGYGVVGPKTRTVINGL